MFCLENFQGLLVHDFLGLDLQEGLHIKIWLIFFLQFSYQSVQIHLPLFFGAVGFDISPICQGQMSVDYLQRIKITHRFAIQTNCNYL